MFRAVVHKGQAASLELLFKAEDFNEDDLGPSHILEFKFTGDMERQYFISQIIEFVDDKGGDGDDEDKKEDDKADGDSDEGSDQAAGDDNFEVSPKIYD